MKDLLMEFKNRVLGTLLVPEKEYLLAISGGMDSMCLADILQKTHIPFEVAHCNFGLRGDESNGDEAFVWDYCTEHGLKFYVKRFELKDQSNIQERARELRYKWFQELKVERGLTEILVAHHADDQLETFFINLLRGSGMKGLAGMQNISANITRPLLFARRPEIEEYVERNNVQFRTDSSNASNKYLRNRVRHELVPLLEEMRGGSGHAMLKSMENVRAQMMDLGTYYKDLELRFVTRSTNKIIVERAVIDITSSGFIEYLIAPLGFSRDTFIKVGALGDKCVGKQFRSSTHVLTVDREKLIISAISNSDHEEFMINEKETQITEPIVLEFQVLSDRESSISYGSEQFDLEKVKYPLVLRKWKDGDRIIPLGMQGSKLVSDLLIDIKMPRNKKDETYVLCSNKRIMWVLGVRISEEFKLSNTTGAVLKISMV